MMEGWKEVRLGEVCDVLSGFAFKSNDFQRKGIPVIKIKNISPPRVTLNDLTYVSKEFLKTHQKYLLSYNDILIAMTGSHINQWSSVVGRVARVRYNKPTFLNQRVGKIVAKEQGKIDISYIYYVLSQDNITIELANKAGGAANQANISPGIIKEIIFSLPPLPLQRKIASILSALDDKIELNNRMNENLEAQAQALFKSWFVDFEPWGGVMPEDWKEISVKDVIRVY